MAGIALPVGEKVRGGSATRSGLLMNAHRSAWVALALTLAFVAAPLAAEGERAAAYQQFRDHFAARRFADALPAAEQVVTLTEQEYGADSAEMIKPLLNLATTQLRLKNLGAAESTYRRALRITEAREGGFSRAVIEPLHGLGLTYYAGQQFQSSADSLRRAVDVSRKLDGLFNINQLPLVQSLIDSYVALNQAADVDREQQYALRLSETAYGRDDPRMLPVLVRSAEWCEATGRYRMARQAHAHALEIIGRTAGKKDLAVVQPLRGIARSYRQEFLYGSQEAEVVRGEYTPVLSGNVGGAPNPSEPNRVTRLDPDGEEALKLALTVLADHPDQAELRGDTLLDLGDWYQLAGDTRDAVRTYREAWAALGGPGGPGTAKMSEPVQLFYRPPSSSVRREDTDETKWGEHYVEVQFTVTPEGRVTDTRTLATDASESQEKSVALALRRARYRPRFVDGNPAPATDVRHRQVVYQSVSASKN
jgi:tetratricopeptide (TPR) repeat protein